MSTDIEELLRDGMERSTRDLRMPAGLARRAAGHLRQRRHRVRVVTATGTATVMAVTGAVVAGVASRPSVGQPVRTVAYVVGHLKHALARPVASRGLVLHEQVRYSAGVALIPNPGRFTTVIGPPGLRSAWLAGSESDWASQGRYRRVVTTAAGKPVFDEGTDMSVRRPALTGVIYWNRTWWRTHGAGNGTPVQPPKGTSFWTIAGPGPRGLGFDSPGNPRALALIARHQYRIAGHQRVDGVNALKLVARDATARTPDTIWVNQATYLPVRWLYTFASVAAADGRTWISQTDYQWLKPTPANLARLDVRIPAGFTRVHAP